MGIIRAKKDYNYSVICNTALRRDDISAKAKGLYAYIMTLPDDWKIYASELVKHFSDGKDSIASAFRELEAKGYITKVRVQDKSGKFGGWDYTVYERPITDKPITDKPNAEKPISVKPLSENPPLRNTDSKNTNSKKDLKGFDQFWDAYAKKVGRGQAERAFRKAIKLTDIDTMIKAINKQHFTDQWKRGYQPHASTWLNGQQWENDVSAMNDKREASRVSVSAQW